MSDAAQSHEDEKGSTTDLAALVGLAALSSAVVARVDSPRPTAITASSSTAVAAAAATGAAASAVPMYVAATAPAAVAAAAAGKTRREKEKKTNHFFEKKNPFFSLTPRRAVKPGRKSKQASQSTGAHESGAQPHPAQASAAAAAATAAQAQAVSASTSRRKRSMLETRRDDLAPFEPIDRRTCNCKNSRCLKLYCECFPAADHELLTNRGFLRLDDVLRLVSLASSTSAVVADWRGLTFASFDLRARQLVYRTPRRLVVNAPGASVVEFSARHAPVSVVATRQHALFCAPTRAEPFLKTTCADVLARFDSLCFLALAPAGVAVAADAWRRAPFVAALALRSRAQLAAFLELYGLWLAVGIAGDDDADQVRFGCAPDLLRARFKRAGLSLADGECTSAGAVRKRSWVQLLRESPLLLDGVLTHLDADALRCVVRGLVCTSDDAPTVRGAALRDQVMQLLLHAGLTATFADAGSDRWRIAIDTADCAAASTPSLQLTGGDADVVREYVCADRTWCVDMDDGFVVVRRVALKDGDNVVRAATRATIQGNCFAAGVYCNESCACIGCFNTQENERIVAKAIDDTQERNPTAFKMEEKVAKGCNCKKSHCLKKYCECFQAGIACSRNCRCVDCSNHEHEPIARPIAPTSRRLSSVNPGVELTTQALPLVPAALDDAAVYLSASQVAAHTVARDWASEAALVDIASSLIKRAQRAAAEPHASSSTTAAAATSSGSNAADALESVATAIRESGEVNVRGGDAASDKYARQERAVLLGVREILDKAVNDLSR